MRPLMFILLVVAGGCCCSGWRASISPPGYSYHSLRCRSSCDSCLVCLPSFTLLCCSPSPSCCCCKPRVVSALSVTHGFSNLTSSTSSWLHVDVPPKLGSSSCWASCHASTMIVDSSSCCYYSLRGWLDKQADCYLSVV